MQPPKLSEKAWRETLHAFSLSLRFGPMGLVEAEVQKNPWILHHGMKGPNTKPFWVDTAVNADQLEAVQWLVARGQDINAIAEGGCTPIARAVQRVNKEMIQLLLQLGADPNLRGEVIHPLVQAAAIKDTAIPDIIRCLVDAGADLDARDNKGRSLLCVAAKYGIEANVRALLRCGATFAIDDPLRNPYTEAWFSNNEHIIDLLDAWTEAQKARSAIDNAGNTVKSQGIKPLAFDIGRSQ